MRGRQGGQVNHYDLKIREDEDTPAPAGARLVEGGEGEKKRRTR